MRFVPFLLAAALGDSIALFAKSAGSETALGELTYDNGRGTLARAPTPDIASPQCIGTHDLPDHECFGYLAVKDDDWSIDVFLNQDGSIERLAWVARPGAVKVHKYRQAANPNLEAYVVVNRAQQGEAAEKKKKGPRKEVTTVKKIVKEKDENGNEIEREVEETHEVVVDDRSFIQKNGVYIVIPLVMFMLKSDPDNNKAKKE